MSSFFSGNLLDECALNKVNFEGAIGLGASKKEVLEMFALSLSPDDLGEGANYAMLEKWCQENYNGLGFGHVYDLIQAATLKKFKDCMMELGIRGNPSAIAIMNEVIRKKESSVVEIKFVSDLPREEAEDENGNESN
mgnify:CR=1 FL=1